MRGVPILLLGLVIAVMSLSGQSGCDGGGSEQATYHRGRDSGQLQAENLRLQEAELQAAARLAVERRRSAQLTEEVGIRRDVGSLMVGTVVMTGCALAIATFTLLRRRRRPR